MNIQSNLFINGERNESRIGKRRIPFQPMEYVCYRFFAERRLDQLPDVGLFTEAARREFTQHLLDLHRESFPEAEAARQDIERSLLYGKPGLKPGTIRALFSNINLRISRTAKDDRIAGPFMIEGTGTKGSKSYGIHCSADRFRITNSMVGTHFKRQIFCLKAEDDLATALTLMRKKDYYQIVVWNKGLLNLLSQTGIALWLEAQRKPADCRNVTIGEALKFEPSGSLECWSPTKTVREAREAFQERSPRLTAILVTKTGARNSDPVGIITPWDFLDRKYW